MNNIKPVAHSLETIKRVEEILKNNHIENAGWVNPEMHEGRIGVRDAFDILIKSSKSETDELFWACKTWLEENEYWYRYEKDWGDVNE